MSVDIHVGDVRAVLDRLPAESVHCVVTSPPYWGLRDYGTADWEGGDALCEHRSPTMREGGDALCEHRSPTMREGRKEDRAVLAGSAATNMGQLLNFAKAGVCGRCGARRIDQQLGLEPTPDAHVAAMVDVFRAVRRVLRPDGVCWVNYGDSYATSVNGRSAADTKAAGKDDRTFRDKPFGTAVGGLKPKDLCEIPSRFALAMQADGWWLRSRLPWVKRNAMPESIKDRPAVAVEYVFLFSRSERYWYDADAVKRRLAPASLPRLAQNVAEQAGSARANGGTRADRPMKAVGGDKQGESGLRRYEGFNARWNAAEERRSRGVGPRHQAHDTNHATLDSTPRGQGRNFRNTDLFFESLDKAHGLITDDVGDPLALDVAPQPFREAHFATFPPKLITPLIQAGCPKNGTVLDPFGGAGTTGLVAQRLGRDAILIELNPGYAEIARRRIAKEDIFA